ncbi:MAG TPA: GntR family transcriptional regulator [Pelolinea sp.]|nr:GntR family transcriptional regulator [Pelolinea sp.]
MFDALSAVPLYHQLVTLLEDQINTGDLQPGQRIPSENELCDIYKISRTTVRQALNDLSMRGKLVRVKGKGTFVAKFLARKPYNGLSGLTRELKYLNQKVINKLIKLEVIISPEETAQKLRIHENDAVVLVERARYIENEGIVGVDIRYLPFSRFNGLLEEDLENHSLYELLMTKYDTFPTRAIHQVCGLGCPDSLTKILELSIGDPVTHFKDVVFDQNNVPFEFGENYYRIDRYKYQIEIYTNNT